MKKSERFNLISSLKYNYDINLIIIILEIKPVQKGNFDNRVGFVNRFFSWTTASEVPIFTKLYYHLKKYNVFLIVLLDQQFSPNRDTDGAQHRYSFCSNECSSLNKCNYSDNVQNQSCSTPVSTSKEISVMQKIRKNKLF